MEYSIIILVFKSLKFPNLDPNNKILKSVTDNELFLFSHKVVSQMLSTMTRIFQSISILMCIKKNMFCRYVLLIFFFLGKRIIFTKFKYNYIDCG